MTDSKLRGRKRERALEFLTAIDSKFSDPKYIVGDNWVVKSGRVIAYYDWLFDTDIPVITFIHSYVKYNVCVDAIRQDIVREEDHWSLALQLSADKKDNWQRYCSKNNVAISFDDYLVICCQRVNARRIASDEEE